MNPEEERNKWRANIAEGFLPQTRILKDAVPLINKVQDLWFELRGEKDHSPEKLQILAEKIRELDEEIDSYLALKGGLPGDESVLVERFIYGVHKESADFWSGLFRIAMGSIQTEASALAQAIDDYTDVPPITPESEQNEYYKFRESFAEIKRRFISLAKLTPIVDILDARNIACRNYLRSDNAIQQIRSSAQDTQNFSVARASEALRGLKEDFFKHGDHVYSQRSARYLFWTVVFAGLAFLATAIGLGIQISEHLSEKRVFVILDKSGVPLPVNLQGITIVGKTATGSQK